MGREIGEVQYEWVAVLATCSEPWTDESVVRAIRALRVVKRGRCVQEKFHIHIQLT